MINSLNNRMNFPIWLFFFSLHVSSCETDSKTIPFSKPEIGTFDNCQSVQDECHETYSPTFCRISAKIYKQGDFLSRGENPCLAKKRLHSSLCRAGIKNTPLRVVHCAPDPTLDECRFVEKSKCSVKDDQPTTCVTTPNKGDHQNAEKTIRSWGKSVCQASNELILEACRRNIRPSLIETFDCKRSLLTDSCPPKAVICKEDYNPHKCSVKVAGRLVSADGMNLCAAKHNLTSELCQNEQNPDKILDVKCDQL